MYVSHLSLVSAALTPTQHGREPIEDSIIPQPLRDYYVCTRPPNYSDSSTCLPTCSMADSQDDFMESKVKLHGVVSHGQQGDGSL